MELSACLLVLLSYSIVKNGFPTFSGENKTICPSKNTENLNNALNSLNNDTGRFRLGNTSPLIVQRADNSLYITAVDVVRNISVIAGKEVDDESEESVTSSDISIMSSILNKALAVSPPTKATRGTYMSAFNSMQKLNKQRLKAANSNGNSVETLISSIESFSEVVELDGNGTVKLESSSLVVSATASSELTAGYSFKYDTAGKSYCSEDAS